MGLLRGPEGIAYGFRAFLDSDDMSDRHSHWLLLVLPQGAAMYVIHPCSGDPLADIYTLQLARNCALMHTIVTYTPLVRYLEFRFPSWHGPCVELPAIYSTDILVYCRYTRRQL